MDAKITARMRKHAGPPVRFGFGPLNRAPKISMPKPSMSAPKPSPHMPAPAAGAPAPVPAAAPVAPPGPAASPSRTWGQFGKENWKPLAAGAAGVGAAGALGPTGVGADLAWRAGAVSDPSRDLGYYHKDFESQRNAFKQKEIDPLMKQYDTAVAAGNYGALPELTRKLDAAHSKLQGNNFGSAGKSLRLAQEAQTKLNSGQGTRSGFFRPLVGGYSTPEGAAKYDVDNLQRDNMPVPYEIGQNNPATMGLHFPAQYRANMNAGAWDPRNMPVPYSSEGGSPGQPGGATPAYYNRLFSSVGLG